MYQAAKTLALLGLNLGWLVPAYLSMSWLIEWCDVEASPLVYGTERQFNSFPFLQSSHEMLVVAIVWLAVAITFHTFRPLWRTTS
jgi:hypothetical protein